MAGSTVFIVSADAALRDSLARLVASAGLQPRILPSVEACLEAAEPEHDACLVLDGGVGGLVEPGRLVGFVSACARIPVLVLTEPGDVPTAVRAIKHGAADVLPKPFADNRFLEHVTRALAVRDDCTRRPLTS
jgi:FixJ family two-component response regulator